MTKKPRQTLRTLFQTLAGHDRVETGQVVVVPKKGRAVVFKVAGCRTRPRGSSAIFVARPGSQDGDYRDPIWN